MSSFSWQNNLDFIFQFVFIKVFAEMNYLQITNGYPRDETTATMEVIDNFGQTRICQGSNSIDPIQVSYATAILLKWDEFYLVVVLLSQTNVVFMKNPKAGKATVKDVNNVWKCIHPN